MIVVGAIEMSEASDAVDRAKKEVENCESQLGLLCGVGSAAELQTRHQILLEPVVKVMEEITTALGHITGEDLLHTEGQAIGYGYLNHKTVSVNPKEILQESSPPLLSEVNNMDTQIKQRTTQSLTTAAEMRETRDADEAHANWEEYLTPAPSIAIMGNSSSSPPVMILHQQEPPKRWLQVH
ncbi:uncharacterized protein AKAME5_001703400 [Lates japonicus]|uniref:Uncharacterized protein n=1 Tax=Lates japonicus TaxID=270547 RepID=A0AAD3N140_LATJO|nr:uncharacterized protein AKAME5_001703400 [Lates japonicus]